MTNRRTFLKYIGVGIAATSIPIVSIAYNPAKTPYKYVTDIIIKTKDKSFNYECPMKEVVAKIPNTNLFYNRIVAINDLQIIMPETMEIKDIICNIYDIKSKEYVGSIFFDWIPSCVATGDTINFSNMALNIL